MMIDVLQLLRERERQQREQHREHAAPIAGDEVELQEVARAPDALELGAEHPQRQHVEQDVEHAAVQEHVGGELPHLQNRCNDRGRLAGRARSVSAGRSRSCSEEQHDVGADQRLQRRRERPGPEGESTSRSAKEGAAHYRLRDRITAAAAVTVNGRRNVRARADAIRSSASSNSSMRSSFADTPARPGLRRWRRPAEAAVRRDAIPVPRPTRSTRSPPTADGHHRRAAAILSERHRQARAADAAELRGAAAPAAARR